MSESPAPRPAVLPEPGEPDFASRRLGDCTLTRRLASGGMGVVYEAVQDPPGRTVAVKVLRAALAGDEARLRFEHEARVLAYLRHPGIAQIYESGSTTDASGEQLPYFVMEHVPEAHTLLEHAAARRLGLPERLRLFVRVCEAVHFGHTKGVIHRDLKPANVLVDGDGAPKVIDFGIARTVGPATAGHAAPHTETGMLVGTLQYMSPEQIAGTRDGVDTRSDVYALGVILYELLTGRLPYDLEGLGLVEIARVITTQPPAAPSRFAPATAGDLSVILAKALAKEPEQRYASAAALGQDVERFLAYTPIQARPPSVAYQLRLFARRHRGAFAASVAAVLALLGAVVVSAWFAAREATERREAVRQRERAEALLEGTRSLVPWLLRDFSAEMARLPGSVTPRSQLATRLGEHLDALAVTERDHPSVLEATIEARGALGDVLGGPGGGHLGRRAEAVAQYSLALELLARRSALGGDAVRQGLEAARLLLGRASAQKELGELAAAQADVAAAHAQVERLRGVGGLSAERLWVTTLTRRADLDWITGRQDAALEAYATVLASWQGAALAAAPAVERRHGQVLAQLALAQCFLEQGKPDAAAPHIEAVDREAQALEAGVFQVGGNPEPAEVRLLHFRHDNIGRGLLEAGQPEAASRRFAAALRAAEQHLAHDPRNAEAQIEVHNSHMLLGRAAFDGGRFAHAVSSFAHALALSETLGLGEPPISNLLWDRRLALTQTGQALLQLGRLSEAEAALERARPLAEARAAVLPDSDSLIGLRDVWGQLSNVSVRRYHGLPAAARWVESHAAQLAALGIAIRPEQLASLQAHWAQRLLRTARDRLALARDALARCRSTPHWNDGYGRDLERIDQSLAAMDEVLAADPR